MANGQTPYQMKREEMRLQGLPALDRLIQAAQQEGGQASTLQRFLLGLYNGAAWPMNLNDLRNLDWDLQEDVLKVLAMDMRPEREIHEWVIGSNELFVQWRNDHRQD